MKWLAAVLAREPAMAAGLVTAIVTVAALLGLNWSPAVVAPALAAITLALSFLVRSRVTPTASVPHAGGGEHEKRM